MEVIDMSFFNTSLSVNPFQKNDNPFDELDARWNNLQKKTDEFTKAQDDFFGFYKQNFDPKFTEDE